MARSREAIEFTFYDELFPRKPSKSESRKIEIIEAVIRELADRGPDQVTHESIAKACGVSRPLVHHYFPDRDELIRIALKYVRARFQKLCIDEIRKHETPARQLEAYVRAVCQWGETSPKDARVWLLFYFYCGTRATDRELNTELVRQGEKRIQALIESGQPRLSAAEGERRAKLLQNLITGHFVSSLTEAPGAAIQRKRVEATVRAALGIAGYSGTTT